MKTIITAIAATLFTASVSAAEVYQGIDEGNSDLFKVNSSSPTDSGNDPDIYDGFAANSDLQC